MFLELRGFVMRLALRPFYSDVKQYWMVISQVKFVVVRPNA